MKNLAVVVMSSDRFMDVWNPFYYFFEKHWQDCNLPIYHISESQKPNTSLPINHIKTLSKSWSEMLSNALEEIPENYILLLLADFFLLKKVNAAKLNEYVEILEKENAAFLRVFPCPGPHQSFKNYLDIGLINKNTPYSISTQATIWNKKDLQILLSKFKDDSELEIIGSMRSSEIKKELLSVKINGNRKKLGEGNYAFTYLCTAVVKGKWTREAINLCKKENIKLDLNYRKAKPKWDPLFNLVYNNSPLFLKHILDFIYSRLVPSHIPIIKKSS